MLCGSPATAAHPPECPVLPGSPRVPLLLVAEKEAASIIHLNVSIKQGYDQEKQETRSFSVKTQLPGLGPRGLLPGTSAPSYCCWRTTETPDQAEGFCPVFFLFSPLDPSKVLPKLSFPVLWPLMVATGCSTLSVRVRPAP